MQFQNSGNIFSFDTSKTCQKMIRLLLIIEYAGIFYLCGRNADNSIEDRPEKCIYVNGHCFGYEQDRSNL